MPQGDVLMALPRRAPAVARQILPDVPLTTLEVHVLRSLVTPLDFATLEQAVLQHQYVDPMTLLSALRVLERRRFVEFRGAAGVHRLSVRTEFGVSATPSLPTCPGPVPRGV